MAKKPKNELPKKNGRPKKDLTEKDVELLNFLISIQCIAEECAAALKMDPDTLTARIKEAGYEGFSDYAAQYRANGHASLRRLQWRSAQRGNWNAQKFLGKNWLGQSENPLETPDAQADRVLEVIEVDDPEPFSEDEIARLVSRDNDIEAAPD